MKIEEGRVFGYARVSTSQQSIEIQKKMLIDNGVQEKRIFSDKITGDSIDRPGLNTLIAKLEEGDKIIITSLDRLGRDAKDTLYLINKFSEMRVVVHFIKHNISSEGIMGNLLIQILAAFSEAEKARILERTNEGRLEAKLKGIKFGRKPKIDKEKILAIYNERFQTNNRYTISEFLREIGISRDYFYKIKREMIKIK